MIILIVFFSTKKCNLIEKTLRFLIFFKVYSSYLDISNSSALKSMHYPRRLSIWNVFFKTEAGNGFFCDREDTRMRACVCVQNLGKILSISILMAAIWSFRCVLRLNYCFHCCCCCSKQTTGPLCSNRNHMWLNYQHLWLNTIT